MTKVELKGILKKFEKLNILVIGDIIADVYVDGLISRISREAPVLILEQQEERVLLGGAANTAHNLATLGAKVFQTGIIGLDQIGNKVLSQMNQVGINSELIYKSNDSFTCTKTRILASAEHALKQQILRIDRIPKTVLKADVYQTLLEKITKTIHTYDGIIIADYGMTFLSDEFREKLMDVLIQAQKPVLVDSRYRLKKYKGATIVTPNLEEASQFVGYSLDNLTDLERAGCEILATLKCHSVLITRGPEGMSLFMDDGSIHHIPVFRKVEVADVSGAGDTVASVMILGMLAGLDYLNSAYLANIAANIVVRKLGTSTLTREELGDEIENAAALTV